jgi:hypothetical protein
MWTPENKICVAAFMNPRTLINGEVAHIEHWKKSEGNEAGRRDREREKILKHFVLEK